MCLSVLVNALRACVRARARARPITFQPQIRQALRSNGGQMLWTC